LIEGFEETPLTGLFDDRWYTSSPPLYFYQKDIIDGTIWMKPEPKITMVKDPPFFMGKSTISTGPFSMSLFV